MKFSTEKPKIQKRKRRKRWAELSWAATQQQRRETLLSFWSKLCNSTVPINYLLTSSRWSQNCDRRSTEKSSSSVVKIVINDWLMIYCHYCRLLFLLSMDKNVIHSSNILMTTQVFKSFYDFVTKSIFTIECAQFCRLRDKWNLENPRSSLTRRRIFLCHLWILFFCHLETCKCCATCESTTNQHQHDFSWVQKNKKIAQQLQKSFPE